MASHSATQDLLPQNSRFDRWRKCKHQEKGKELKLPTKPAASVAEKMTAEGQNTGSVAFPENEDIDAGYTFVGQWLAHDITMARNLGLDAPQLRLLTLYGSGPSAMTSMYAHYPEDFDEPAIRAAHLKQEDQYDYFHHAKFKLKHEGADQYDVPRLENQVAIMADNRNDQHVIICQLYCAFARFHNALTDWLQFLNYPYAMMAPEGRLMKGQQFFTLASKIVIWCYQRMLAEDYLPTLLPPGATLIAGLSGKSPAFKLFDDTLPPQLMPEYAMAAMRIGHSQTKEVYQINRAGDRFSIFSTRDDVKALGGFQKHKMRNFEWDVFFETGIEKPKPSAAIDHWIAKPLTMIPFRQTGANSLPVINLERSEMLPAGDELAQKAGFNPIKVPAALGLGTDHFPLWLYVLLEAELTQGGNHLGDLGSQIIAEQIMWVLRHDPMSAYAPAGNCHSLSGLVDELFDRYDLDNFFGSRDVLTKGLEQLGMNETQITMPWMIKFPSDVAQKIENLRIAQDNFGRQGSFQPPADITHKTADAPPERTQKPPLKFAKTKKTEQEFIKDWLDTAVDKKP